MLIKNETRDYLIRKFRNHRRHKKFNSELIENFDGEQRKIPIEFFFILSFQVQNNTNLR